MLLTHVNSREEGDKKAEAYLNPLPEVGGRVVIFQIITIFVNPKVFSLVLLMGMQTSKKYRVIWGL